MHEKRSFNELGLEDLLSSVKQVTKYLWRSYQDWYCRNWCARHPTIGEHLGFMEKSRFEKELADRKNVVERSLKSQMESW